MKADIEGFLDSLAVYESPGVFNPWRDYAPGYDMSAEAPAIRRKNLREYLLPRVKKATYVIVAEAVGYQGGRFSGIAMTCERMLLGHHAVIRPNHILPDSVLPTELTRLRTSATDSDYITKRTQKELGFNEPTDTVVWSAMIENGIDPYDVLLWNIFPFHPFKEGAPLSNRTPTREELEKGWTYTKALLDLQGPCTLLAVGQKAAQTMETFGCKAVALRHPANGGATKYRDGFAAVLRS